MSRSYDAIIVGGGHNGLTTAAYLAKAGRSVLVLERRHLLGGAAVSEEIYPGFIYSVCSYVVSLLRPEVIQELNLAQHGLNIVPLEGSFTPMENGDYMAFWPDEGDTREEIKRHSIRDADRYTEFNELMYDLAYAVKPILGMVPPDLISPSLRDLGTLRQLAKHLGGLSPRRFHYLTKIMTMSAADFLEEWFETDVLRASIAINGIIGTMLGPHSPGTAYVLLHHYMGELDGAFTAWGSQIGGTGGLSEALASAARSWGAETRCSAPVDHVIVKNGRAKGVVLENGEEIEAKIVVSGCDPRVTFEKLVDSKDLPDDLVESIRKLQVPRLLGQGQSGPRRAARVSVRTRLLGSRRHGGNCAVDGVHGARLRRGQVRLVLESSLHGRCRAHGAGSFVGATGQTRAVALRAVRRLRPREEQLGG